MIPGFGRRGLPTSLVDLSTDLKDKGTVCANHTVSLVIETWDHHSFECMSALLWAQN